MRTRYSSLVKLKKSTMDKSERVVQKANAELKNAVKALEASYSSLEDIKIPKSGNISDLLASRGLLCSQRDLINHNKAWVDFAKNQLNIAKQQLKADMVEYEKFKYLEFQEIKKMKYEIKIKESKELDEIALMTYEKR